jgi:20S proteasome alpha/beta subunit
MTICLAVICDKGERVIMASDSMLTSSGLSIEFEHRKPKLMAVSNNCVMATAGDALVHTELHEATCESAEALNKPTVGQIVDCVKKAYTGLRQQKIVETILLPKGFEGIDDFYHKQRNIMPEIAMTIQRQIDRFDYGLDVLLGGVDTRAHIHGIENPGTSAPYDSIGYSAIGSGYPHATTTFIANEYHEDFPLHSALLVAYEAKKISEKAPGVGANMTNMCVIAKNGVKMLSDNDIRKIDQVYKSRIEEQKKLNTAKDWAKELSGVLEF